MPAIRSASTPTSGSRRCPTRELTRAGARGNVGDHGGREDRKDVDPNIWTPAHAALIKSVAEDPKVERIFVNAAIKKALCRYDRHRPRLAAQGAPDVGSRLSFPHPHGCPAGSPDAAHRMRCRPATAAARSSTGGSATRSSSPDGAAKPKTVDPEAKAKPKPAADHDGGSAARLPAGAAGAVDSSKRHAERGGEREAQRGVEHDVTHRDHQEIRQGLVLGANASAPACRSTSGRDHRRQAERESSRLERAGKCRQARAACTNRRSGEAPWNSCAVRRILAPERSTTSATTKTATKVKA